MSGSHYEPDPTPRKPDTETTHYDLRTVQQREDDAIDQLALRVDNLLDVVDAQSATIASLGRALAALRRQLETVTTAAMQDLGAESHKVAKLAGRVTDLERETAALRAALSVHADLLQHYRLQEGI